MAKPRTKRKILAAIEQMQGWTSAAEIGSQVQESAHVVSQVLRTFRGRGWVESEEMNMKDDQGHTLGLSWRYVPPEGGNQPAVESRSATARFPPRQREAKRERVGRESALNAASPSPSETDSPDRIDPQKNSVLQ